MASNPIPTSIPQRRYSAECVSCGEVWYSDQPIRVKYCGEECRAFERMERMAKSAKPAVLVVRTLPPRPAECGHCGAGGPYLALDPYGQPAAWHCRRCGWDTYR